MTDQKKELRKYTKLKHDELIADIDILKKLKKELVSYLHENDDGFSIYYLYKGYNYFINHIDNLYKKNINHLKDEEFKILSYISKIKNHDLRFMIKTL